MAKHKHYDLIMAWASGAEIECRGDENREWFITYAPEWHEHYEYRIKPDLRAVRDMAIARAVEEVYCKLVPNKSRNSDYYLQCIINSVKDES